MVTFILFLVSSFGSPQGMSRVTGPDFVEGKPAPMAALVHAAAMSAGGCDACPCKDTGTCSCPDCSCGISARSASKSSERSCCASAKAAKAGPSCCEDCCPEGCKAGCCQGGTANCGNKGCHARSKAIGS